MVWCSFDDTATPTKEAPVWLPSCKLSCDTGNVNNNKSNHEDLTRVGTHNIQKLYPTKRPSEYHDIHEFSNNFPLEPQLCMYSTHYKYIATIQYEQTHCDNSTVGGHQHLFASLVCFYLKFSQL